MTSDPPADRPGEPTPERVQLGVDAARQLRAVLQRLPALASRATLARLVVDDVVAAFDADTVALGAPGTDGWWVLAESGLTAFQKQRRVPNAQPLFRELQDVVAAS